MKLKTSLYLIFSVIGLILYIFVIIAPTSIEAQMYFAISLFILEIIAIKIDKKNINDYVKYFIVFASTTISLRYFYWRTLHTLNFDNIFNALGSLFVYAAELYTFILGLLGAFITLKVLERKSIPLEKFDENDLPRVDIFIPTYNESIEILKPTVLAANSLDYPIDKFNIYILDDGGTKQKLNDPDPKKREEALKRAKELKELTEKVNSNVHYITREKNLHAKAGNINEAMKKTHGDLILILDADHIPTQDFLRNTVGFFLKYPKVFLVQTPHKFYNADPVEKNLRIFRKVPSENEMFYGFIQKGLDFWSSSFFCGSAAILRRKYLEEVGGIAGETITEDAETALELHSRGYDSIYYPKGMVFGLQPESFSSFLTQRSRWAQGMIQIFILKNPLFKKGLKWYQKLGYLNSNFFWFFGLARTIFLFAPFLFIFFGIQIYNATLIDIILFALPHFIFSLVMQYYIYGKYRWPFFSEVYESAQSLFLLPAVIDTIINPTAPTFNVTPKGENLEENFVSPYYKPIYILFNLTLLAFIIAIYKFIYYPQERGTIIVIAYWMSLNFLFLALAIIIAYEKAEKRKAYRIPANDDAFIKFDHKTIKGKIKDISLNGILIQTESNISEYLDKIKDHTLKFIIKDVRGMIFVLKGKVVNSDENNIRMKLLYDTLEQEKKVVEIVFTNSSRWEFFYENTSKINPIKAFLFLFKLTLKDFFIAYKELTLEFIKEINEYIKLKEKIKYVKLIFKGVKYGTISK